MFGDVPLVLVEDAEALQAAVAAMRQQPAIAVDIEADSFHHYREKVCLVQVSIPGSDFVIDPLSVVDLEPLGELLADSALVKVFHGADYDVVSLKRDYGFQIRGLFDTMIAAQFLNLPRLGLADLIDSTFGIPLDKKYQRHDWAKRPLQPEHLDYARGDTHWLLALRELMIWRLGRAGYVQAMREECQALEQREWQGRGEEPGDFLRVKGAMQLDEPARRVLRALYEYREEQARKLDRPVFKVIPDPVLLVVARRQPSEEDDLQGIVRRRSALMRQHGPALLRAVQTGLADERELPTSAPRKRGRSGFGAGGSLVVERLRTWRKARVAEDKLPAVLVASNQQLKEIGRKQPGSMAELAAIPELRSWQVARYGEAILDIVLTAVAEQEARGGGGKRRRRRKRKKSS